MKVLQLSKFYWPVMGGIETVALELARGLNTAGHQADVLCAHQRPFTAREHLRGGYQVVRAASLGMLLSTSMAPALVWQLRRMARGRDIIHVHMPDPMAALAIWAVRPQAKLVVHWHSDVIRQRRAMRLYEPLQRWLLQRADAIISTSQTYAEHSAPLKPWLDKVTVVPIGITDNRQSACTRKAAELRARFPGRRIVFSLGRMAYYKGYDVLIDAASRLPEDVVVLIGGDGELLEQHRRLVADRGLSDKVHLLGHIGDNDLPSHFEACDVFCMPSTVRSEAYGVAMVEAMVMGKPIVSTDIDGSGVPWVNLHGQTGLNVPIGDSAALASTLATLLGDDALRARLGAAARRRFERDFNASKMVADTIALYRKVLAVPAANSVFVASSPPKPREDPARIASGF